MKVEAQKSFEKDIAKIKDKKLADKLLKLISDLEGFDTLSDIRNLKKMVAKGSYFRIRVGEYRLGMVVKNDTLFLLRFMHRKEIYKYFP